MTNIKFFRYNNRLVGFECLGHTGYEESGKDVLCASISTITQSIALGLRDVCNIDTLISRDDEMGYIKVEIPKDLSSDKLSGASVLLDTLFVTIKDLVEGYPKYIKMEVIEYVY